MEEFLRDFLVQYHLFHNNKSLRNTYINLGPVRIYVRKSQRFLEGRMVDALDIASIDVEEEFQQKGYFTSILRELLAKYPTSNFFIESVLNDNVRKVGEKFGFKIKYQSGAPDVGYDMFLLRK